MSRNEEFHEYVMSDVFAGIPGITSRAMFGGWGIYKEGKIFAIIVEGELYFKVRDSNRSDFESRGSHPFTYENKGKKVTMSYWLLPEEIMENREALFDWVERSLRAGGKRR
jgi:DNA transformation protein